MMPPMALSVLYQEVKPASTRSANSPPSSAEVTATVTAHVQSGNFARRQATDRCGDVIDGSHVSRP